MAARGTLQVGVMSRFQSLHILPLLIPNFLLCFCHFVKNFFLEKIIKFAYNCHKNIRCAYMSIFMYPLNNLKKIIFIYEQCLKIYSLPFNKQLYIVCKFVYTYSRKRCLDCYTVLTHKSTIYGKTHV